MSDPDTPPTTDAADLGYTEALSELDAILRELEASDVDVDRLADRVGRASELIRVCRERISSAEVKIQQVTTDLAAGAGGDDPND